jgi:hypothetical protein
MANRNRRMPKRKASIEYSEQFRRVFGTSPRATKELQPDEPLQLNKTTGGGGDVDARPSLDRSAGGFLLTGGDVVYGLLNLQGIKDPDRWLKRHRAPVALAAAGVKRYVAEDVLRWAAMKFAPTEEGQRAILAIAETMRAARTSTEPNLLTGGRPKLGTLMAPDTKGQ